MPVIMLVCCSFPSCFFCQSSVISSGFCSIVHFQLHSPLIHFGQLMWALLVWIVDFELQIVDFGLQIENRGSSVNSGGCWSLVGSSSSSVELDCGSFVKSSGWTSFWSIVGSSSSIKLSIHVGSGQLRLPPPPQLNSILTRDLLPLPGFGS